MIAENLTIPIIVGAALVDSVNPCVLGVLIFLLAFMTTAFQSRTRMLLGGLFYSLVVYVTYLALGLGILKITVSVGISTAFYWVAALVAIAAGLFEIKDFFWYGKGFSLQMIPGASARIKYYTSRIAAIQQLHPGLSILFIGILGVFVVLVELPCTGAPYFAVLALLSKGAYSQAVPFLLLYNFIFVLPLLAVIAVAYFGTSSERLEQWRQSHRGLMRLIIGVFLICLGVFMLYSIQGF
jgi:cytochrome c biogenesis protein CcdA